jgi:hypothetical protein
MVGFWREYNNTRRTVCGAIQSGINKRIESWAYFCVADMYDLPLIGPHKTDGSSLESP